MNAGTDDALTSLLASCGLEELNFSDKPTLTVREIPDTVTPTVTAVTSMPSVASESTDTVTPTRGLLCLNMIVKNESKIITRLFDSILGIIDTFCICDTGSTDNTVEIIREYFKEKGKPGLVYTEPFQNFGYNRTHALNAAKPWGIYALLLDADMKLKIDPAFDKTKLVADGYQIIQGNGGLEYYNLRIVKTDIGVRCVCPTHEYYSFPNGRKTKNLPTLRIEDIGDGGCKSDKFVRDVRLLTEGIKQEPKNERYHFYLANSFRDLGDRTQAIEYYKKRIALGGWVEEVFYAAYECGKQYAAKGDMPNAISMWLDAYDKHPTRAESLYEIVKYYRDIGKQRAAQIILDVALKIPFPKNDVLFVHVNVYKYLLDYEQSILYYYTGKTIDHKRYLNLIGSKFNQGNVLSNYKFYAIKLSEVKGTKVVEFSEAGIEKSILDVNDTFCSSSPCIIKYGDGYMLNVRYVNYTIRGDGTYTFKLDDGKIRTLQKTVYTSHNLDIGHSVWIDEVMNPHLRYQGVEDVKIFPYRGSVRFIGTVQHPETGNITVGHGIYGGPMLVPTACTSPYGNGCEKNWCYFTTEGGDLRVVYSWSPLRIGEMRGTECVILEERSDVPQWFGELRGSSCGARFKNELWFTTHFVEYSAPRHYYHVIVVLDAKTLKYKRHSNPFTFHREPIEYSLGLIVEHDRLLISYSVNDACSRVVIVPAEVALSVLDLGIAV